MIFSEQGYHTFFNNYRATIKRLGFWKILLSLLMPFKVVEENCSSIQFLSHYNAIDDIVSCRIHAHPIMANRYPKAIFFIGIIGKKIDSIHYGMSVKLALAHMHICIHVHARTHIRIHRYMHNYSFKQRRHFLCIHCWHTYHVCVICFCNKNTTGKMARLILSIYTNAAVCVRVQQ